MSDQPTDPTATEWDEDSISVQEIGDVLDLHVFSPRQIPTLVVDYLDECIQRGFDRVRIIHGKGIGNLRRCVHGILRTHPGVANFKPADESAGGWGATIVQLRKP